MIDKTKLRNASERRLLKAIFHEMVTDKTNAIYTLKDDDYEYEGNKYISLYKRYMEMEDLAEFDFANTYLTSYEHWEMLTNTDWFKPYADRWRKELDLKIKSRALAQIKRKATEDSRDGMDAMKYLLERKWEPKDVARSKVGRPSKEEIKNEANKLFEHERELLETHNRLAN